MQRRFAPRNDTSGWCRGAPAPLRGLMLLHKAVTDRRYSQTWRRVRSAMACTGCKCLPEIAPQGHFLALRAQGATSACGLLAMTNRGPLSFYRYPIRIGSIAPGPAVPSPTTRKQLRCTTPDFRQNVFDISGAGGYNKDVETQTVATNITYLFPICELDHSQISESSGCDRRLTFFLSEANRRSGRDAR